MASNNVDIKVGNLTNVEIKEAKNGSKYLRGRLSVSMGQDKESSWFGVICFSDQAENLFESWMRAVANKGNKSVRAIVIGKTEVSTYGDNNEKTAITIVADEIGFSTKFAVINDIQGVSKGISTDNVQVQTAAPAAAPAEPVARPQSELSENDAPF